MSFTKENLFNTLSFRIFAFFWLTFSLLSILIFSIPYFDSRIYSELTESELSTYQQEIITSIRNNHISRILAGVPLSRVDRLDSVRPVLVDESDNNIMGATPSEIPLLNQFVYHAEVQRSHLRKCLVIYVL